MLNPIIGRERPILFSAPMVRALLTGEKTQTRRVVGVQPPAATLSIQTYYHPDPRPHFWACDGNSLLDWAYPCPHGSVGDRLYVRETWQHSNWPSGPYDDDCFIFYRADYVNDPHGPDGEKSPEGKYRTWRPSIHMPRTASRITLEIVAVRVERLNDCSATDAYAEGAQVWAAETQRGGNKYSNIVAAYKGLWESINGADSWMANPWVWVIEFKKVAS